MISFAQCKEYMICLISFSKFPDELPAFNLASAICKIGSICRRGNILSTLPFCWLLKLRNFLTIVIIFSGFSFSGIFFLIIVFLKSINTSLI